jgi:hypothetical protein
MQSLTALDAGGFQTFLLAKKRYLWKMPAAPVAPCPELHVFASL